MANSRTRVAVIFGSRSVEHEVSIVTALQAMAALDPSTYQVIPIYITKQGAWLTGDKLKELAAYADLALVPGNYDHAFISPDAGVKTLCAPPEPRRWFGKNPITELGVDVAFPLVHGTFGEDGTLQGLFDLADIPYVGCGVLASALGMDKIAMKAVFKEAGLPVVDYQWLTRRTFLTDPPAAIARIEADLRYPLFVKPANLGSSIGITKATDRESLLNGLEVAASYDTRILVEEGLEEITEINCAVLGYHDPKPSVCEQPVTARELLSYEDKYLKNKGAGGPGDPRRIPAPISAELTARIQDLAIRAFKAIDGCGVARVDCLVNEQTGDVRVNEINTIPGSLAFYLWEPAGVPFPALLDQLIGLAFERHAERKQLISSYDSDLIRKLGQHTGGKIGGAPGSKMPSAG